MSTNKPAVILFTDIGQDLDDTLSLFVLLGAREHLDLVAVVTGLSRTNERAALVREYLELLNYNNVDVIAGPEAATSTRQDGSDFPVNGMTTRGNRNITESNESCTDRIFQVFETYKNRPIYIMGIGPLTALHHAISDERSHILKRASRVYLQGHVFFFSGEESFKSALNIMPPNNAWSDPHGDRQVIYPGYNAFNYKFDLAAARSVFNFFRHQVPMRILGKFAAYQVKIKIRHLKAWSKRLSDAMTQTQTQVEDNARFFTIAKSQQSDLRKFNHLAFSCAHPEAPPDKKDHKTWKQMTGQNNDAKINGRVDTVSDQYIAKEDKKLSEYFDAVDDNYGMVPAYDPLLALVLVEDVAKSKSFFTRTSFNQKPVPNSAEDQKANVTHCFIGNSASKNGVKDAEMVLAKLTDAISEGIQVLPA